MKPYELELASAVVLVAVFATARGAIEQAKAKPDLVDADYWKAVVEKVAARTQVQLLALETAGVDVAKLAEDALAAHQRAVADTDWM